LKIKCVFKRFWILPILLVTGAAAEGASGIDGELFGQRGGYVHGFLSVAEQWTDNLFYTRDNMESDFTTWVSPGIRLALPGTKDELLTVDGSTTAPGGMSFGRLAVGRGRGFQAYLSYAPEFEFYADHPDEDTTTHSANGLLSWRMRSGLVLELIDQISSGYQDYDEGTFGSRDEFTSNLLGFDILYPLGTRLDLRVGYQNYVIDYDSAENDGRDRSDHSLSGYLFYKVGAKSSVFLQYQWVDIEYDLDNGQIEDSVDQSWFGGFRWDITAKSSGSVKIGYGEKENDDQALGAESEIVYEAQVDHNFTPKSSLSLRAYRRQEETTIETTDYTLSQFVGVGFAQQMTYRIQATLDLDYLLDQYRGGYVDPDDRRQRDDNTYTLTFGLNYAPRGWLSFGLEYGYEERDSNFDANNYTANRVLLRVTGAL
jgi:hypothetical protein